MMGVLGVGTFLGPLVGGFFTDNASWRWCFYVNVPIGIAALAVVFIALQAHASEGPRPHLDILGAFLIACVSALLVFLTSWAGPSPSGRLGSIPVPVVTRSMRPR